MADEGNHRTDLDTQAPATNGADTAPQVAIISQYVKDLSVENPNAPQSFNWQEPPQIDVQFNIGSRAIDQDVHEVELKINVSSKTGAGTAFLVELAYCSLIGMRNMGEELSHPFLFAEAPRLLFPFARRVLADAIRDAGFPPLMLEPIDFNGLYLQQLAERQAQDAAGEAPAGNA